MRLKGKFLLAVVMLGLVAANFTSAALVNCGGYGETGKQPPCGIGDLIGTVRLIINFLLSWAWLVSILFIVISGFRMVFSGGNEEAVTTAKTSLGYAIGGFIIIMLSFVILNLVVGFITGAGSLSSDALFDAFKLVP